jgi:hypothetical protein
VLQPRQPFEHRGFDNVACLFRRIQQFGGLTGATAIAPVRDERRQNVEEQPGDMALEDFGDLVDRSQAHIISGRPIEPNHHVLDHGELILPTPNRWFRR